MRSIYLTYPNDTRSINLESAYQYNRLTNVLTDAIGNHSDYLEYDLGKCNKIIFTLKDLVAVICGYPVDYVHDKENDIYLLDLVFKSRKEFQIPIWGEKRARNAYYNFSQLFKEEPNQNFIKIMQTNRRDYSLIKFYEPIQLVHLTETSEGSK